MKKHKTPKPYDLNHVWVVLGVTLIIILLLLGLSTLGGKTVGEAFSFGQTPVLIEESINLDEEESIVIKAGSYIFDELDKSRVVLPFKMSTELYQQATSFDFVLNKRDEFTYDFRIETSSKPGLLQEVLDINGDSTTLYLDTKDDIPDLKVKMENGQITITNLRFISGDVVNISLFNKSADKMVTIVPIEVGSTDTFLINASSDIIAPPISARLDGVEISLTDGETNINDNYATKFFSYTAPAESKSSILEVSSNVGGLGTKKYYTFAVGNMVYALNQPAFPRMTFEKKDETSGEFNVTFRVSTDLQPLAVPCDISNINTALSTSGVKRILSYGRNNGGQEEVKVWDKGSSGDFTTLSAFIGYFVILDDDFEDDKKKREISITCPIKELKPRLNPPPIDVIYQSRLINSGWNLVSIPGVVPRPLTEFTDKTDFILYECRQGYKSEECVQKNANEPLNPGKPYWIFSNENIVLGYKLE
jgi:hypothetical protein